MEVGEFNSQISNPARQNCFKIGRKLREHDGPGVMATCGVFNPTCTDKNPQVSVENLFDHPIQWVMI